MARWLRGAMPCSGGSVCRGHGRRLSERCGRLLVLAQESGRVHHAVNLFAAGTACALTSKSAATRFRRSAPAAARLYWPHLPKDHGGAVRHTPSHDEIERSTSRFSKRRPESATRSSSVFTRSATCAGRRLTHSGARYPALGGDREQAHGRGGLPRSRCKGREAR